jgi:hypothetical protein
LFVVIGFGAGEFIVGLQAVRADVNALCFGVTAEIDRHTPAPRLTPKQPGNRAGAGCVTLECFDDGAAQSRGSVLLEEFEQLAGLVAG